ncbi:MAG: Phage integrase [Candidatus Jettenia ecosi]|uniref:Phage integrase n=1 Tax=Candidatus Jettenia ecosi TaxID=2494326 RepID=A0A533QMW2_9BACT|nr:MAG: Phage integrase [Candidatus Jettenia ecosi]
MAGQARAIVQVIGQKRANGEYKTCGTWCIEFFDDNKEWQSLTFGDIRNKSDAEKRLALFISDRERGQLNLPKKKHIPTLVEYSKTYLELHKTARENTIVSKRRAVNAFIRHLREIRLDKITPFIIEKYRIDRKKLDGVKESSINQDVIILTHILNTAIKAGLLDRNPCREVKRFKITQSKDRILSESEVGLLFNKLTGKDRLIVLTSLFIGMRLGEVLRLKWSDIDFVKGLITFIQSKTGRLVTIPLSSFLAEEFQSYQRNSGTIFEDRVITRLVAASYSQRFNKLFKSIGIDNFSFHSLRHCFASISSDTGSDIVTTKELLGHSDVSMTMRYNHKQLDAKRNAIERITDHILDIGKEKILPLAAKKGTA